MILLWSTSVSPKLYKNDNITISILCIHCWSINFFSFWYTVCFYDNTWYLQGQTFPCIDGCNTCICLGNNNVGSTFIDCCKLKSCVYLANLFDKLGKSRYVMNISNVYPYNSCVCLLIAVICLFVSLCLCLFVFAYLFNCLFLTWKYRLWFSSETERRYLGS